MIAIAESGSTKTQWAFIDENRRIDITSGGFNAYSEKDSSSNVFVTYEVSQYLQRCDAIHFYGSGVSNEIVTKEIINLFHKLSPASTIQVYSDLLAAARAAFGNTKGIIAILGTGSNAGYFDGKKLLSIGNPSLGYILGDEGAGVYFGKVLLHAYFNNLMPDFIRTSFKAAYKPILNDILKNVYAQDDNRKYIASFTPFLNSAKGAWRDQILDDGFDLFIKLRLLPIAKKQDLTISFVGSVAYAFHSELVRKLKQHGLRFKEVIQYPMERLIAFHKRT